MSNLARGFCICALLLFTVGALFTTEKKPAEAQTQQAYQQLLSALKRDAERMTQRQRHLMSSPESTVEVQTSFGNLTGVTDGVVTQFLGVPFATPPLGNLRWSPPLPAKPWPRTRNATWWQKACPQNDLNFYWGIFSGMGEDCLYLNVYYPAGKKPPPGGWPVMVWFYGGGFAFGSDSLPVMYDGYNIIASGAADVMIVTVNYRVATIGFLGGDLLQSLSPDGSTGNWGLLDMKQGLEFTRTVIAPALGGNPLQTTIFGESAGGAAVSLFLTNPSWWGLFERAIIESGPLASWISRPAAVAEKRFARVADQVGCLALNGSAVVDCMRKIPWENFTALEQGFMDPNYGPTVDGVAVPMDPVEAGRQGILAPNVPILMGVNHDEGTLFSFNFPTNLSLSAYAAWLNDTFGEVDGPEALALFPPSSSFGGTPWGALARIRGDVSMVCPSLRMGQWLEMRTQPNTTTTTPVFMYMYDHINSFLGSLIPQLGVPHASELINVWNIVPELLLTGPGEDKLSLMFVRYWSRFATTGNPNGGADPIWNPLYNSSHQIASGGNTLVLNISLGAPTGRNLLNLRLRECNFFDRTRS